MNVEMELATRAASMGDGARAHHDPTLEQIAGFLRQHVPAAAARPIDAQTPLLASALLDSLGVLQLVAFLSDELGVEIHDEDFSEENFATVGALLALIARKRPGTDDARPSA